jgi:hypothetical protein
VPDRGSQGQDALQNPDRNPDRGAAAVAFQVELPLEGLVDRLDKLPQRLEAVWPAAGGPGEAASVAQTERFLAAYAQARGRPWTRTEREVASAAGLWVHCFNAKKDAVVEGGPQLDRLAGKVATRSRNAGF